MQNSQGLYQEKKVPRESVKLKDEQNKGPEKDYTDNQPSFKRGEKWFKGSFFHDSKIHLPANRCYLKPFDREKNTLQK